MSNLAAFILAGGRGQRLSILTRHRAKPAVPFGGNYRIIDFTMTNCVRSGISHVYVLTQYISRSLVRHLGIGKPWDMDRREGGLRILHPRLGYKGADWYQGTADAIYQNITVMEDLECENVLILSGDHVYRADYTDFLNVHRELGATGTMGVVEVPDHLTNQFGIATVGPDGLITRFDEKPESSSSALASMGIYIFNRKALISILRELKEIYHDLDFGKHVVPYLTGRREMAAYGFDGYWLDIGTIRSYFMASRGLLTEDYGFDLYGRKSVLTVSGDYLPMLIGRKAEVENSIICSGCSIEGEVRASILSPGVKIEEGAVVEDSVIFHNCRIESGARVKNCILDKRVLIGKGSTAGYGDESVKNRVQPEYLDSGITLIGRKTVLPPGINVGTNCIILGNEINGAVQKRDYRDGDYFVPDSEPE